MGIYEFQILAALSRAQKNNTSEFTKFFYKGMKNIKLGHALRFNMHKEVFSQKKHQKNIWFQ